MIGYLLDTNAVSMFSPSRTSAPPGFVRWMEEQERLETLYLSAMTIHEIEKGVRLLEAMGATSKAALVEMFLQGLIAGYGDRILPVDAETARASGKLEAKAVAAGYNPGAADAIIAGTGDRHGLTIITWNLKHFQPFGVAVTTPDRLSL